MIDTNQATGFESESRDEHIEATKSTMGVTKERREKSLLAVDLAVPLRKQYGPESCRALCKCARFKFRLALGLAFKLSLTPFARH